MKFSTIITGIIKTIKIGVIENGKRTNKNMMKQQFSIFLIIISYISRTVNLYRIESSEKFVLNGVSVLCGKYPFYVDVFGENNLLRCSGVLVGKKHVITSKQCLMGNDGTVSVVKFGCDDAPEYYRVNKIFEYNNMTYPDFCILELKNEVKILKLCQDYKYLERQAKIRYRRYFPSIIYYILFAIDIFFTTLSPLFNDYRCADNHAGAW